MRYCFSECSNVCDSKCPCSVTLNGTEISYDVNPPTNSAAEMKDYTLHSCVDIIQTCNITIKILHRSFVIIIYIVL